MHATQAEGYFAAEKKGVEESQELKLHNMTLLSEFVGFMCCLSIAMILLVCLPILKSNYPNYPAVLTWTHDDSCPNRRFGPSSLCLFP